MLLETNINHLYYFNDIRLQQVCVRNNVECFPKHDMLPKRLSKEILEKYKNIDDLIKLKAKTYYDTIKFEKCTKDNAHLYKLHGSLYSESNKKHIQMYFYYPYKSGIEWLEIHDLYYSDILYQRISFSRRTTISSDITHILSIFYKHVNIYSKLEKFQLQYNDIIYALINNNKSFALTRIANYGKNILTNFDTVNTLKNMLTYHLDTCNKTFNSVKISAIHDEWVPYTKKVYSPITDYEYYNIIESKYDSVEQRKLIYNSNTCMIEYGIGNSIRRIMQFVTREKKTRSIATQTCSNTGETVIIDANTNKLLGVAVKNKKKDINDLVGYKIARITFNNKLQKCILEVKIPTDARVATDGYGKYRCDKLIPQEVYINIENGIKKIPKGELKGLYCETSVHHSSFKYYIDQLCEEPAFNPDLNKVCTYGLHYCLSIKNAVKMFAGNYFKNLDIIE